MLKAPFPYFGGKSSIFDEVWYRFGDVRVYSEPFAGSMAVLLGRPDHHAKIVEIVNDIDCHIANFWRSVQYRPEELIDAADYPINENDLHARHSFLIEWMTEERRQKFIESPSYCEPQLAGWWLWGICQWIGGQWCQRKYKRIPELTAERGILAKNLKKPMMNRIGNGIFSEKIRHQTYDDRGIHSLTKRPMLGSQQNSPGTGIHRKKNDWKSLIMQLQERLKYVKVCSGDWKRVCTDGSLGIRPDKNRIAGIFLDPPYSHKTGREKNIYSNESSTVADECRQWCIDHTDDFQLRIALCGVKGEHDELEDLGWEAYTWKSSGGMAKKKESLERRKLETIWFSPNCNKQLGLF